jgi:hypothetical protein
VGYDQYITPEIHLKKKEKEKFLIRRQKEDYEDE